MSSADLRRAASRVPQLLVPGAIGVLIVLYVVGGFIGGCSGVGESGEEIACGDGVDNDGDGDTDCFDSDCAGVEPCGPEAEFCDDGIDNDGDGDIDCADVDCAGFPGCEPG